MFAVRANARQLPLRLGVTVRPDIFEKATIMTQASLEEFEDGISTETIEKLTQFLGWFSVGLASVELLAPRGLRRWLGDGSTGLLRFYGARELGAGLGILAAGNKAPFVWTRVGGDVIDIATLLHGLAVSRRRGNVALSLAAVAGITALDLLCARALTRRGIRR